MFDTHTGVSAVSDNIDEYSDGPLQTTPAPINELPGRPIRDNPSCPGPARTTPITSLTCRSCLTPTKPSLRRHSLAAGFGRSAAQLLARSDPTTYNRYTYYRLLSQMGVESAPEQNKLNLNYVNVDANGNIVPNMETNLIPWTNALQFFTNAADRMLRAVFAAMAGGKPVELSGDLRHVYQHQHGRQPHA